MLIAKYPWKNRFKYSYFVCWIKKNIVLNDIIELLLSDIQWLVKKISQWSLSNNRAGFQ